MKKFLIAVLAIALTVAVVIGCVACTSSDLDTVLKNKKMVIGITLYAPMNYYNADETELIGFDTEFTKAVCKEMGIEAEFQVINWESKIIELNSKRIDCIWNGFTVKEELKEQIDFSTSYLKNTQCVVSLKSNVDAFSANNGAVLAEKKGVAEASSAGESVAKSLTSSYNGVDTQTKALIEVLSGTADFAVVDVVLAKFVVGTGDFADLGIAISNATNQQEEYAIGFRKGSDLTAKVNEIIAKLDANGELAKLAEKYGISNQLI